MIKETATSGLENLEVVLTKEYDHENDFDVALFEAVRLSLSTYDTSYSNWRRTKMSYF